MKLILNWSALFAVILCFCFPANCLSSQNNNSAKELANFIVESINNNDIKAIYDYLIPEQKLKLERNIEYTKKNESSKIKIANTCGFSIDKYNELTATDLFVCKNTFLVKMMKEKNKEIIIDKIIYDNYKAVVVLRYSQINLILIKKDNEWLLAEGMN